MEQDVDVETAPAAAAAVFGDRLVVAQAFVAHLADTGVSHGLLGPRELPRLWSRHVLNCAVLTDLLPPGSDVIDIGSGAGLPGIALAIRRPDLRLTLVEPLLRRVTWLEGVLAALELDQVVVRRGRAQEFHGDLVGSFVTARAVAPLDRLLEWSTPLLADGGVLLALKGRQAQQELEGVRPRWATHMTDSSIVQVGGDHLEEPTTVVRIAIQSGSTPPSARPPRVRRPSRTRRPASPRP